MTYVSLAELKDYLKITTSGFDAVLDDILAASATWIDNTCGAPDRQFTADVGVSARAVPTYGRVLTKGSRYALIVPDIASPVGLLVDGVAFTAALPSAARPITELLSYGGWADDDVVVTARWGWPSVPDPVVQAQKLLASRLWKRKDSPEGVLGNDAWGLIRVSRIDPDVMALLDPYVLAGFA
jgi:hypothetical protein